MMDVYIRLSLSLYIYMNKVSCKAGGVLYFSFSFLSRPHFILSVPLSLPFSRVAFMIVFSVFLFLFILALRIRRRATELQMAGYSGHVTAVIAITGFKCRFRDKA